MVLIVLEVNELKYEVEFDIRGCLKAVVASKAVEMAMCTWI